MSVWEINKLSISVMMDECIFVRWEFWVWLEKGETFEIGPKARNYLSSVGYTNVCHDGLGQI